MTARVTDEWLAANSVEVGSLLVGVDDRGLWRSLRVVDILKTRGTARLLRLELYGSPS